MNCVAFRPKYNGKKWRGCLPSQGGDAPRQDMNNVRQCWASRLKSGSTGRLDMREKRVYGRLGRIVEEVGDQATLILVGHVSRAQ